MTLFKNPCTQNSFEENTSRGGGTNKRINNDVPKPTQKWHHIPGMKEGAERVVLKRTHVSSVYYSGLHFDKMYTADRLPHNERKTVTRHDSSSRQPAESIRFSAAKVTRKHIIGNNRGQQAYLSAGAYSYDRPKAVPHGIHTFALRWCLDPPSGRVGFASDSGGWVEGAEHHAPGSRRKTFVVVLAGVARCLGTPSLR